MFQLLDYFFYCFYCLAPANGLARPGKATNFLSLFITFLGIDLYVVAMLLLGNKLPLNPLGYFLLIIPFALLHWRYYQPHSYEHILARYQGENTHRVSYAMLGITVLLAAIVFPFIVA